MKNNTAVILCGGKGSRLGSIGKKMPKTLVKIHSKPILWYLIKSLARNKFNHLVLPVGYKGKMIQKYIKRNKKEFHDLKIDIVETGVETTIAKRLHKIKKYISSKDFLLLNGDAIFDFNLFKLFNMHVEKGYDITFLGNPAQLPYGVVIFKKGKISDFQRDIIFNSIKKNTEKDFIGYVYSGISIINKKIMNLLFKDYKNFEKEFYPKVIKKFKSNFSHIKGIWYSIDNQKDISSLNLKNTIKYKSIEKIFKKFK